MLNEQHQLIELSPNIPSYQIDSSKNAIGIDLGTEYCYAGQYIHHDGKNYVKILKIGGNGRDKLWSGVAFEGKTIHVGEAAKYELSIRKQEKRPLNGAFRIREITGTKFEKVNKRSLDYNIACDEIGRIAIVITDADPTKNGTLVPEEINNIFVQSIIQDLTTVYNFQPTNIIITQSDKMKEIDTVITYGIFKQANTNIDRVIKDCEAAICAYGLAVPLNNYIIFYFGEADSWATLVQNGRITSHVRNGICGLLMDTMNRQLKGKEFAEKSKKLANTLGEMIPILAKSCGNEVDGIILAGSDIHRPMIQGTVAPWRNKFIVYDSIPTEKVIVVGATVISAKRLHDQIQNNPLDGVIREMAQLSRNLSLYNRDTSSEVFQPPPTYESIVNTNRERAPTGTPPIELNSPREQMAPQSPNWNIHDSTQAADSESQNEEDGRMVLEITRL
uniref:Uncharacterized protein n=1 Tax=Panagrolaimus davidi TaxID=227884 RepID=A0A914QP67_9BILA